MQEGLTAELNCATQPGCTLLLADPRALEATRVHVPLTFVEGDEFDVMSRYSAAEEEWFQEGLQLTGSTESAFQTTSAQRTLWMLALAGVSTGGKRAREGAFSHTSTYSYSDYLAFTELAARFDYTLDEIQKVGSLFWSWFIQGLPDLVLLGFRGRLLGDRSSFAEDVSIQSKALPEATRRLLQAGWAVYAEGKRLPRRAPSRWR